MANEPQDIVIEARELLEYYKSRGMGEPVMVSRLANEVERLREHVKAQNIELEGLRYSRMFSDTHVGED